MIMYVTYCSRTKSNLKFGKPEKLYISNRVKSFFKHSPKPRGILSHKYGLIFENEIIDNYDQDKYNQKTVERLKSKAKGFELIFYSPRKLVEGPWLRLLDSAGISYEIIRSIKNYEVKI